MKNALLILMATLPGAALAHPGHNAAHDQGVAHWLTSADHVAVLVAVGLLFWAALMPATLWVARTRHERAQRRARLDR